MTNCILSLFTLSVLLQLLFDSTARAVFVHLEPQFYHNIVPCIVSPYCPYINVFSAQRYFILSSLTAAYLITQRCLDVFLRCAMNCVPKEAVKHPGRRIEE